MITGTLTYCKQYLLTNRQCARYFRIASRYNIARDTDTSMTTLDDPKVPESGSRRLEEEITSATGGVACRYATFMSTDLWSYSIFG